MSFSSVFDAGPCRVSTRWRASSLASHRNCRQRQVRHLHPCAQTRVVLAAPLDPRGIILLPCCTSKKSRPLEGTCPSWVPATDQLRYRRGPDIYGKCTYHGAHLSENVDIRCELQRCSQTEAGLH